MSGPWEDFSTEAAPWEEFKAEPKKTPQGIPAATDSPAPAKVAESPQHPVRQKIVNSLLDMPGAIATAAKQGSNAMGQVALAPLEMATGKPSVFTQQVAPLNKEMQQYGPVAQGVGQAIGGMVAAAPAAALLGPVTAGAQALGPVARVMGAALQGGVQAAATTGVPEGQPMLPAKVGQFEMGAATGAALGGAGEIGSAAKKKVADFFFGNPAIVSSTTPKAKELWATAKKLGFDISPGQTSAGAARIEHSGATEAQRAANTIAGNKLVTAPTGLQVENIAPTGANGQPGFIQERLKTLGKQYDAIYDPSRSFYVDASAAQELRDLVRDQEQRPYSMMTRKAKEVANFIADAFDRQVAANAGNVTKIKLKGDQIQLLRNELSNSKWANTNEIDRRDIGDVIVAIDQSVERNNPGVREALKKLNPQYAATKTLAELEAHKGIDFAGNVNLQKLGELLKAKEVPFDRHPLGQAGELGVTFGIRPPSAPAVVTGRTITSSPEDVSTRASVWRRGVQLADRIPAVKNLHEENLLGLTGQGITPTESAAIGATSAAISPYKMKDKQ